MNNSRLSYSKLPEAPGREPYTGKQEGKRKKNRECKLTAVFWFRTAVQQKVLKKN